MDSFHKIEIPIDLEIVLIVVENDIFTNCMSIVESSSVANKCKVIYAHEPRLGIPIARNRCLLEARGEGVEHIIFVDDDEIFDSQWLQIIWSFYLTLPEISIVQGSVISMISDNVPAYFQEYFQRKYPVTGSRRTMCITNNVLVPISVFDDFNLSFDESTPLMGGEDSTLFRKIYSLGVPMIHCAEALMYEKVPDNRATKKWLGIRRFRIGLTIGAQEHFKNIFDKYTYFCRNFAASLKYFFKAFLYFLFFDREKHLKAWLKAYHNMGRALGVFGYTINEYQTVDGF